MFITRFQERLIAFGFASKVTSSSSRKYILVRGSFLFFWTQGTIHKVRRTKNWYGQAAQVFDRSYFSGKTPTRQSSSHQLSGMIK
jgi:hypothetical protein